MTGRVVPPPPPPALAAAGITEPEDALALLVPMELVAVTVNVYEVPLVRPVISQLVVVVVQVAPLLAVTV